MTSEQSKIRKLSEEVRKLSEELAQCQADKEFVWSLWKHLQVANPDLTHAISLVIEREKQKAEVKDRKILEILQVKDNKIQELEKQVAGQQKEINNLVQRKVAVDEENERLQKEITDFEVKLKNTSKEHKDSKKRAQKSEEQTCVLLKNLEEEKQGLSTRCSDLLNDLEKLKKQAAQWKEEKSGIDSKVKLLKADLKATKIEVEDMHNKNNELSSQLAIKATGLTQKDADVTKLRKELNELQNLYSESTEHANQQNELIQQLQALNLDTQKVLRNQEDVLTSENKSYQKLYNELNVQYDALKSSEARLRQSQLSLTALLHQKDQQIRQLLEKRQENLESTQSTLYETTAKNVEQRMRRNSCSELESLVATQKTEIKLLKGKLIKAATERLTERIGGSNEDLEWSINHQIQRRRKDPSVKRSRSLSPKSCAREAEELRKLQRSEHKFENLEKLVKLKSQENEELKKVHDQRLERLHMLQASHRALKEQLKELEDGNINVNLGEEVDQLRVQCFVDKATIQELTMCLEQEREDLLLRLDEDKGVKCSTPKVATREKLDESLKQFQISNLEKKLKSIEKDARHLKETNTELAQAKMSLKRVLENQGMEIRKLLKENEQIREEKNELHVMMDELKTEASSLKRQIADTTKLRHENAAVLHQMQALKRVLGEAKAFTAKTTTAERASCGHCRCKTVNPNARVRIRKKNAMKRYQSSLNRSIKEMSAVFENFSKDGWEDISEDSDSKETAPESLGEVIVKSAQKRALPAVKNMISAEEGNKQTSKLQSKMRTKAEVDSSQSLSNACKEKKPSLVLVKRSISFCALQHRLKSLQGQFTVIQNGKRAALNAVRELKEKKQKLTSELTFANQRFQASKQTIQKLTFDLNELQQQKDTLDKRLNQMMEQQPSSIRSTDEHSPLTSSQTPTTPIRSMEAELKQLQSKLKNATNEISKRAITIKTMKAEKQLKEEQIRELQEKIARMERDITMKRQLVEDLKSRLKSNQENDNTYKGLLADMEMKVKTLTEESSSRKAFTESLKQRLNVATKARSQYEQMYNRTIEELEKKNQKLHNLKSKVIEAESAMTEIETTASQQLHGLAMQSGQALEVIQQKLILANGRVDEFNTFVKCLSRELYREIESTRTLLKKARKKQKKHNGLSQESINRAQSMAASILNISQSDLEDILELEDEEEQEKAKTTLQKDQEWLAQVQTIMESQLPFASRLAEVVLEKMGEKEKLSEDCALLLKVER
ncbi:centlein isoform X3 [Callorhinchus milii]|uniref:centlein isoform X3 n=1 Tax=Callorhinchus milii TaxID=7868 RepID=UPI001C3FDE17|nr:centlein isoform X3 [Callorhinchus milii]